MPHTLKIIPGKCTGCKTCEVACSFAHTTNGQVARARIRIHAVGAPVGERLPTPGAFQLPDAQAAHHEGGPFVQITCLQCLEAACVKVCPTGALARDAATGAILLAEGRCVGCGLCEPACPFGHLQFDRQDFQPVKCDLCNGQPACARFCPAGALVWS